MFLINNKKFSTLKTIGKTNTSSLSNEGWLNTFKNRRRVIVWIEALFNPHLNIRLIAYLKYLQSGPLLYSSFS